MRKTCEKDEKRSQRLGEIIYKPHIQQKTSIQNALRTLKNQQFKKKLIQLESGQKTHQAFHQGGYTDSK